MGSLSQRCSGLMMLGGCEPLRKPGSERKGDSLLLAVDCSGSVGVLSHAVASGM